MPNQLIASLLPTLATALGGPLAGAAASFFASKLGLSETTVEAVKTAIAGASPEQLVQMKTIDADLQKFFATNKIDYEKIAAADRDSARKANVSSGVQWGLFWLSLILLSACLGSEAMVLFVGYPKEIPDIVVGRVLGLFDAIAMMVMTYWYGTTNGSAQKTTLLSQAQPVK